MRVIVQEDVDQVLEKDIIVEEDIEIVEAGHVAIIIEKDILDIRNLLDRDQEESIEVIDTEEEKVVVVIREDREIIVEEVEIK